MLYMPLNIKQLTPGIIIAGMLMYHTHYYFLSYPNLRSVKNSMRNMILKGLITIFILGIGPLFSANTSCAHVSVINSFNFLPGWVYVRDLAWEGNSLWVAENATSSIYKMDPLSWSVMSSFADPGTNPWGLAWDGVNVLNTKPSLINLPPDDTKEDYVYSLTTTGQQLNSWLAPLSPNATPHGLAFDAATDSLWLSDSYTNTIFKLNPSTGSILSSLPFPDSDPRGLAWDGQYLWAIDNSTMLLYKLSVEGAVVDTFSIAALGSDPEGLAWDGQSFWISENSTDKIYQVSINQDSDGDGYPVPADCDDSNPTINPETYWYQDNDEDGFGTASIYLQQCSQPGGPITYVMDNHDYDDNNPDIGPPLRIYGAAFSYYSSLQAAYDAASDGDTIQVIAETFAEDLSIDKSKSITVSGGYDGAFSINAWNTILNGNMTVSSGVLTIENFIFQ